ncbi:MAG: tRNA pseudouridine(38-40) synthase TruA [Bdellovibrionota bacterium]
MELDPPKKTKPYRVRLDLSFDGSLFMGWQKQSEGAYTVQGVLEEKLSKIFKETIAVQASGRTDRGVHALHQVAHFDCSTDPTRINLRTALQASCPRFLVIKETYTAPKEFHARRDALEKTYKYLIRNAKTPSSQLWNKSVWIRKPLDLDYLNEVTKCLIGTHDFKSFQNAGTELKTTTREIYEAKWVLRKPGWVEFYIRGNGFLKQMVRNIVGTALALEKHGQPIEKMKEILEAKNRKVALKTADPEGLYLVAVKYPQTLDNKCLKF